jgi:hypothetical protein
VRRASFSRLEEAGGGHDVGVVYYLSHRVEPPISRGKTWSCKYKTQFQPE